VADARRIVGIAGSSFPGSSWGPNDERIEKHKNTEKRRVTLHETKFQRHSRHLAQRQIAPKRGAVNASTLFNEHGQLRHKKLEDADLLKQRVSKVHG